MKKLKCTNCGQYKLQRFSNIFLFVGFISLFVGLLTLIFLIGIVAIIMSLIPFSIGAVIRLTGKGDKYICQNCKKEYLLNEII